MLPHMHQYQPQISRNLAEITVKPDTDISDRCLAEFKRGDMSEYYILEGREPKVVDLMAWGRWFGKADRKVANTKIGDTTVSTVFLGLDHSFGNGPPLLFETLVFGGELADEMDRYETYEQAEAGHKTMVAKVEAT